MGQFLTTPVPETQIGRNKYRLEGNTLFKDDDGTIYLAWRGFETDNFTWLRSATWDTRCSHIHDVGCEYHKLVVVTLTEAQLRQRRILRVKDNKNFISP